MKMTYDEFNAKLQYLADQIIDMTDNVEASLDASDEDVEHARAEARTAVDCMLETVFDKFGLVLDDAEVYWTCV